MHALRHVFSSVNREAVVSVELLHGYEHRLMVSSSTGQKRFGMHVLEVLPLQSSPDGELFIFGIRRKGAASACT